MPGMRMTAATLLLLVCCGAAAAAGLSARHAWIRLLPGDLPAAGYLELVNTGADSVRLTGAQSPGFGTIELHESSEQSGVARMRRVERLAIPAGGTLVLEPRGYHLMLSGPSGDLQPGERVPVTLEFSDGTRLPVSFLLRDASGR